MHAAPNNKMIQSGETITRGKARASDVLLTGEPERGVCAVCDLQIVRYGGGIWHHVTFNTGHPAVLKR